MVHEHVENEVKQQPRPARQQLRAAGQHIVRRCDRARAAVVVGDEAALAHHHVDLAQQRPILIPARRVDHEVEIGPVVVHLGAVDLHHHVLEHERVDRKRLERAARGRLVFSFEVDPHACAAPVRSERLRRLGGAHPTPLRDPGANHAAGLGRAGGAGRADAARRPLPAGGAALTTLAPKRATKIGHRVALRHPFSGPESPANVQTCVRRARRTAATG